MNDVKKERAKENRRKLRGWVIAAIILFSLYSTLLIIEAAFFGGNTQIVIWTLIAGSPVLIWILSVYFAFPWAQRAPLYLGILTQIIFLTVGAYLMDMSSYFMVMIIVVGVVSIVKNARHMAVLVTVMFVINIIMMVLFIPGLERVDTFKFFMQFVLFSYGSLFLFIQTFRVTQKESGAERALSAFSSLLDSTPNYTVITDSQNRVQYISQQMVEFARYSAQKYAVGQPLIDLFADKALKLMFADILNADGFVERVMTINIDGAERHFKVIANKLSGGAGGLFIDISDVTPLEVSRKSAEAANASKSSFLAKMSHEIRTPMNAIIGMAELALREELSPQVYEQVTTIKQAGNGLLSIINDILDFSKIESGKLEIIPSEYLFASLINDVISIIRMRLVDSPVRFVVNVDCNLPNALFGDEIRIRQIMLNILSNAVKYTEKGYVSFTVFGEFADEDTVNLTMEVADSGKGIKEEDIDKLFNDFAQVGLSENKGVEGTGLGLSITRNLIAAMGGDVTVESEYGVGSVFTVTLPQKARSREKIAVVKNPEEKRVVVYEKRDMYADSIVCTIDNLGVSCTLVSSDTELYEELVNNPYNFVFIAASLFENVSDICSKSDVKVILLAGFGETIANEYLSIISMPVHSISVANILNGTEDNYTYNEGGALNIKFTAPDVNVLVVDDVNTNLNVAAGLLAPYQMKIDLCLSGAKAIEAATSKRYDLIFMDHMMPEMDGIEAASRIKALGDPHNAKLPIVALTANAVSGTREMFLENGFNDFLSKPIDTVKMNSILEKWLPKEKQLKISGKETKTLPVPAAIPALSIDGLDIQKGVAMSGGKIESYIKILSIFTRDGIQKIREIEKCLETDNLPLYTTYVHALKSAAANVGATELSEMAAALEKAGRQEDLRFIQTHNPKLLSSLNTLINGINGELKMDSPESEPKKSADTALLKAEFAKLEEAIGSMDLRAVKAAVKALQPLADGMGGVVEEILRNAKIGEYDKALSGVKIFLERE